MIRPLLCLVPLAMVSSIQSATAQTPGDTYCGLAPLDMLAALEGTWTIEQGMGLGVGRGEAGAIPFPVPPQPGKALSLTVDPANSLAYLRGDGQEMALIAVPDHAASAATAYLSEAEKEGLLKIGDGCDWHSLPVMLGSNRYELDASVNSPRSLVSVNFGDGEGYYVFCSNLANWALVHWKPSESAADGPSDEPTFETVEDTEGACVWDGTAPPAGEGELIMSLAVRFQSPTYGTGVLQFSGVLDGYSADVKAPVVFTR